MEFTLGFLCGAAFTSALIAALLWAKRALAETAGLERIEP